MPETAQSQPITLPTFAYSKFFSQVYMWMTGGLLLTALTAFLVNTNLGVMYFLFTNSWVVPLIFILELVIVVGLSAMINKLNAVVASFLFLFYSVLNGIFFGLIVAVYTEASVFLAFGATAGTFLIMSLFGFLTKRDLTSWGTLAIMGVFGLILGTVLNIFVRSDGISWVLTFVGIILFIILIAYDTQKLKHMAAEAEQSGNFGRLAILGALNLYLDFINLFIRLLQIFGKQK